MNKTELLNSLEEVFSSLPYLHQRDFYTAVAHEAYEEYVDTGKKKRWNEISRDDIEECYDFLYFLDPDVAAYYLPTYMKLLLEADPENDEDGVFLERCSDCFFLGLARPETGDNIINELSSRRIELVMDFTRVFREAAPDFVYYEETEKVLRKLERAIASGDCP